MNSKQKKQVTRNVDRLILLSAAHHIAYPDMREIIRDSTFLYEKENNLKNVLLEAFAEMTFVVNQFQRAHEVLLTHGTPELDHYIKELNEAEQPATTNFIIELHAYDLSTYFKSFLLLARAVLDKVVPLYSYRFFDTLNTFGDHGNKLIKRIVKNKNVQNKTDFISLIEEAKSNWLDSLIGLRDEYAHYSNLNEYRNFWIPADWCGKRKISGILDFHRPSIEIAGEPMEALEYMLFVKVEMIQFLRKFLLLCEFTPDRRPRHYLSCEECGIAFAKKSKSGVNKDKISLTFPPMEIRVKDRAKDYGLIICPKCGGKTDTDLQFWEANGMSFYSSKTSGS